MKIEVMFEKPIYGYWDGGAKSGGTFEIQSPFLAPVGMTKFGCWGLNFYFSVKTAKTIKETCKRAQRWIYRHCRVPNVRTKIID